MALKAGRRGLHKRLVDAFGNLNGEAPSGEYYTKQQTDDKFETKTNANNMFQKKTLEVPLEMLSGSKLTVEDALQGLNEEKFTYADNGVLGARNFLDLDGTVGVDSGKGLSASLSNYALTITGQRNSSTGWADISVNLKNPITLKAGVRYKLDCGITPPSYIIGARLWKSGSSIVNLDAGQRYKEFTLENDEVVTSFMFSSTDTDTSKIYDITVKPQVLLADDNYDGFTPRAMTNRELTEELAKDRGTIVTGFDYERIGGFCLINVNAQVTVTAGAWTIITSQLPFRTNNIARAWFRTTDGNKAVQTVVEDVGSRTQLQIRCEEALSDVQIRGQIIYGIKS